MEEIRSLEHAANVSGEFVLLFGLPGCAPCDAVKSQIEKIPDLNAMTLMLQFSLDAPWHKDLVRKYRVPAYPTLIFIRDQEVLYRMSGAHDSIDLGHLADTVFSA
jgi:thioredoxin-related protein